MEPTTQPNVAETTPVTPVTPPVEKKNKKVYIIILAVIIVIVVTMILLKSKVLAPVATEIPVVLSAEDQKIDNEIVETMNPVNENDLKQIDKEF